MHFFGGDQWEGVLKIKADLLPEQAGCAGAGAVVFVGSVFKDGAEEVFVGCGHASHGQ